MPWRDLRWPLTVVLAGLLAADLAVLTPLVTGQPGILGTAAWLGGPLLALGGLWLLTTEPLAHRRWLFIGLLALPLVLAGYGLQVRESVGEFGDLAAGIVLTLALAAYLLFLAAVTWRLAPRGQRWPPRVAALVGTSVALGVVLMPWAGALSGRAVALLLVGVPMTLLTFSTAALAWQARGPPGTRRRA